MQKMGARKMGNNTDFVSNKIQESKEFGRLVTEPRDESAHMITESGLNHIECLLDRANKEQKSQSKWDFIGKALASSSTTFITVIIIIITDHFDDGFNLPTWLSFIFWVILVCSLVLSIFFHLFDKKKAEEWESSYKSYISEIIEILNKVRKNEPKGSNQEK